MEEAIRVLIANLVEQGIPEPLPASVDDMKRAQAAGFPDELVYFYQQCHPDVCIELKQRIWSIEDAIVENTDAIPGYVLSPYGYIAFASTLCGDAYCIDTNITDDQGHHPIVLFSHDMVDEDSTLPLIQSLRVEVASSLEDFLMKFTDGTLSEEPSYG